MKRLLLSIISIAILAALVFTLAGCKKEDPYIIKTEINEEGELVVHYNDGKTENLGSVENGSLNIDNPIGLELTLKDDDTYSVSVGNAVHLSEIVIPAKYAGKPVTDIDSHGFANLKNLTKITIPSSIIGIGSYAFSGCENLAEISSFSPNLIHIGDNAFSNCPKLTSLKVDELNPIYEIVNGSLYTKDGKTLVKCILPEGATSYNIGASVTEICVGAFVDCKNLKSLTFDVTKDWMYDEGYIPDYIVADAEQMAWYANASFYCTYKAALKGERDTTAYALTEGSELSEDWESLERCNWVWFEFKPTVTGYYYFDFINGENELTPSLTVRQTENGADSEDYTDINYSTNSVGKRCYKLNNEYTYLIQASGLNGFEYSKFATTVSPLEGTSFDNAIEISDEQTTSVAYLHAAHSSNGATGIYLEFTPDTAGFYTFDVSGFSNISYLDLYVYSENNTSSYIAYAPNSTTVTAELSADTTYYLRVYYSYSYNTSSSFGVTANVSKVTAGAMRNTAIGINLGKTEAKKWDALDLGDSIWFKFTPSESAYYQISAVNASSILVYQNQSTSYMNSSSYGYWLVSDNVYYIKINTTYASVGLDISKVKMGANAADAIALTSSSQNVGYNSSCNIDGEMWFKFDVQTYDDYAVYLSSLNSSYHTRVYIYSDAEATNQVASATGNFSSQTVYAYGLFAGTYYVKVEWAYNSYDNPSASYADSSFKIYYHQY